MHVEVERTSTPFDGKPSPVIFVNEADVENTFRQEVAQILVEKENGEYARFWVSVRVSNGRPKVYVTTKIGKGETRKQVERSVQGTFNL